MSRTLILAAAFAAVSLSSAHSAVLVTIDKSAQQMVVELDGRPLYQWPVSTGKPNGYDTPNGKFKAFRMERDHFSKEWDDAPMPFSIFFTQKGHAIHGSLDVKRLGTPASHGCVRLLPANAEKLFQLVEKEGVLNTTVVLTGTAPSSAPAVARRRAPQTEDLDAYARPQNIQPYGQQQYGQQQYGQQQYGQQRYEQPYGQLPRPVYGQPAYGNPYYAQQYAQPQYQQPQYAQPYGAQRGYITRDSYSEPYQQRPRTLFPFD